MEFKGLELVASAQLLLNDEGRSRVHARLRPGVEAGHHIGVILHHRREHLACGLRRHQLHKALRRLRAGLRVIAIQAVKARSRMRVKHRKRRIFLRHVFEYCQQNCVLEHIGVVACVEGVAVTEHAGIVPL